LKTRKDVRLRHFFLCDECANAWTSGPFAGNAPLYEGESVEGYCGLCNKQSRDIKLRTWFLCDICCCVAGSIGRNHVAEEAIIQFWQENVAPKYPTLTLVQKDISSLMPRRDTDLSASASIDFIVVDEDRKQTVFGIENKTGRSSINEMSQFQLDVSDCDTILNDMQRISAPAYVVHAQVLEIWEPPTMGFRIVGLWWSDVYTMSEHFKSIRTRRDEMRGAAYFGKKAFYPMSTFAHAIMDGDDYALLKRYEEQGPPQMYCIG
jgi:hypothetical protein